MNAIIYCRVSSRDQIDGTSLESQETACREYAARNALPVARVFIEEGESAKFADRTQLLELLRYCKDKGQCVSVLIVWKLDRFARNVEDHYAVKASLRKLGVRVASVTEPIDADPNGKLMETILAGFAQFDNDIRALRTVQGMRQRLREGIFPWRPPLGYLSPKIGKKTQPDLIDPGRFEVLQRAWRLFATGSYTKADILRLLQKSGIQAYRSSQVSHQFLDKMFRNPYYKGTLRDPWSGEEYIGRHPPMATPEEFAKVQQVIKGRNKSKPHSRLHPSFPLRGIVRCPSCENYMTSCFAQGRRQRYPYYLCFRRDCPTRSKSYSAGLVHEEFLSVIRRMAVPDPVIDTVMGELADVTSTEDQALREARQRRSDESKRLQRQLDELISMRTCQLISDAEFARQRAAVRERLLEFESIDAHDDTSFSNLEREELRRLLTDLVGTWNEAPLEEKAVFGRLLFPLGCVYQRIRTAERGLIFEVLEVSGDGQATGVHLMKTNVNTFVKELKRFLAVTQSWKGAPEAQEQAA